MTDENVCQDKVPEQPMNYCMSCKDVKPLTPANEWRSPWICDNCTEGRNYPKKMHYRETLRQPEDDIERAVEARELRDEYFKDQ